MLRATTHSCFRSTATEPPTAAATTARTVMTARAVLRRNRVRFWGSCCRGEVFEVWSPTGSALLSICCSFWYRLASLSGEGTMGRSLRGATSRLILLTTVRAAWRQKVEEGLEVTESAWEEEVGDRCSLLQLHLGGAMEGLQLSEIESNDGVAELGQKSLIWILLMLQSSGRRGERVCVSEIEKLMVAVVEEVEALGTVNATLTLCPLLGYLILDTLWRWTVTMDNEQLNDQLKTRVNGIWTVEYHSHHRREEISSTYAIRVIVPVALLPTHTCSSLPMLTAQQHSFLHPFYGHLRPLQDSIQGESTPLQTLRKKHLQPPPWTALPRLQRPCSLHR